MFNIEDLPSEVLLEIFKYLPAEELVLNVQNVCIAWRQVARHPCLWKHRVYSPNKPPMSEEMVSFVEKCPMLRHIDVVVKFKNKKEDMKSIVNAVVKNCSDIRTFCVKIIGFGLDYCELKPIFEAFPNIESLTILLDSFTLETAVERIISCKRLKKLIVNYLPCGIALKVYGSSWVRRLVDDCPSLESLKFFCQGISEDDQLYVMEKAKDRFVYLQFIDLRITQQVVDIYATFTKLQYLKIIHREGLAQVDFRPLANIKTLKKLHFSSFFSEISHVETIFELLFADPFPLLENLTVDISYVEHDRNLLNDISMLYPKLKHLVLSYTPTSHHTFENIPRLCNLESLCVQNNSLMTDVDVEYISKCSKLKVLNLSGCSLLTDKAVDHLTNCKDLEFLDLSNSKISHQGLRVIRQHLHKLKRLHVSGTGISRMDVWNSKIEAMRNVRGFYRMTY